VITIFRHTPNGLSTIDTAVPGSWIHVVDPSPEEYAHIQAAYDVPESFLSAALDVDELARTDKEQDSVLIIILIPYIYTEDPNDVPFSTTPLSIVLVGDYIITISKQQTSFVADFVLKAKRTISTAKRNRLILQLFYATAQRYLGYLRQIEANVDIIQRRVQRSLTNKELLELLRYQKSYIYFRTSLESNNLMLKRLQRSQLFDMYPDDRDLLDDALTESEQATEMTKIASDILNQMMDAYASIISNNLNDVLKILAVATIILNIPTVLTSMYGMNVPLPWQASPWAFTVIMGVSLLIILVVFLIFRRRRWL
jgi:magnesium transporter